ncbi:unnamed protein product [Adineta ricciae]|uniref:Uncharacterized protein n=1 Tax=Adineta ricciae TaxID=249248 RepID=A0A815VJY4_ADIRI|nr:unnamed protein product [Adineta ricciae]CAF1531463.1 unnamed protein product [Adineta ricciae]
MASQEMVYDSAHSIDDVPANFREFVSRQKNITLLREINELIRLEPKRFQYADGVFSMSNSSIKWASFIYGGFSSACLQASIKFCKEQECEVFFRLISYNPPIYSTRQPLFDVFKSNDLLLARKLHYLELELFNIRPILTEEPSFVKSFDQFLNNMDQKFCLSRWSHLIDYSKFHIAGGCLLTSLRNNLFTSSGQDIDLFYKGPSYSDYLECINQIEEKLCQYFYVKRNICVGKKIINMRLFTNSYISNLMQQPDFIDLQFVFIKNDYAPDELLTKFDIDISQFSFDGKRLYCTMAAAQGIRTGTMIHYGLHDDDIDFASIAIRIGKYMRRGFRLLYPVQFNIKRFDMTPLYISNKCFPLRIQRTGNAENELSADLLNHNSNSINDYQYPSLTWSRNYDYFHIQQKFRFKLLFGFEQSDMFDYF